MDHVEPFALGGSHEAENLRVLCAAHNRRAAERVFGTRPRWKSWRDCC
ncbi:MAG TPA: HNH endonuclease signature motif containing protein [Candidatus Krumholzibacteria bacterium]|nr:HNH endonuclease signature motif containing protein [Candidatus Krumholzibacteria bacterium]